MGDDMMRSLEQAGAVEKGAAGLWRVTKAGREMSTVLATLSREPGDDGINFDYTAWQEKDKVFDHAAFDAKMKEVDDEAFGSDDPLATLLAASERIMNGVERPPFKPNATYNKHGDGLEVYLCDEMSYTQWLCPGVEVMRAHSDRRVIGFSVWGLSRVVARDGGELRRLPDKDERFLTVKAPRLPDDLPRSGDIADSPIVPSKPVGQSDKPESIDDVTLQACRTAEELRDSETDDDSIKRQTEALGRRGRAIIELSKAVSREIVVSVSTDYRYIAMGLYYPDGDSMNIHLIDSPRGPAISDDGLTAEKLYDRGICLAKGHQALLSYIKNRFGVELNGPLLVKQVSIDNIGCDCLDFCEAISFLSALAYQKTRTKVESPEDSDSITGRL